MKRFPKGSFASRCVKGMNDIPPVQVVGVRDCFAECLIIEGKGWWATGKEVLLLPSELTGEASELAEALIKENRTYA